MKSLEILKDKLETLKLVSNQKRYEAEIEHIKEAIREIEELENRNCENCKYYNNTQVCDIFIARSGYKSDDFFCNKWVTE